MISPINHALDAKRLTMELKVAETKIAHLETELSQRSLGHSFYEVAKDFDATVFYDYLMEQVVDNLAPLLEQDVLTFLKTGVKAMAKERICLPPMSGFVAYDKRNVAYVFEFRFNEVRTRISVDSLR